MRHDRLRRVHSSLFLPPLHRPHLNPTSMHTTIGYRRRNLRRALSRICRRCRDHRGNPSEPSLGFEESWPTLTKVRLALFQLKFPSVPRQAQPRNCHLADNARVWGCLKEATLAAVSAGRSCAWRRLHSEDASSGISLIKVWQFGSRLVRGRPSEKRECWKGAASPTITFPADISSCAQAAVASPAHKEDPSRRC